MNLWTYYAVVFAADVRTTFDEFRKTMVATAIAKTIITVNPGQYEPVKLNWFFKVQVCHL